MGYLSSTIDRVELIGLEIYGKGRTVVTGKSDC
jgi:hypothetical protein